MENKYRWLAHSANYQLHLLFFVVFQLLCGPQLRPIFPKILNISFRSKRSSIKISEVKANLTYKIVYLLDKGHGSNLGFGFILKKSNNIKSCINNQLKPRDKLDLQMKTVLSLFSSESWLQYNVSLSLFRILESDGDLSRDSILCLPRHAPFTFSSGKFDQQLI